MDRASELMARAGAKTSLEDFGDESFREGLDILVRSANEDARLNDTGRAMFDGQIVDLLVNRLQVEHWYRQHPEIDEQEIVAPLIGLGLPRTGSTALSHLLAADPAVRSLRLWESFSPCPPPDAATEHDDPRIAAAELGLRRSEEMSPRHAAMTPTSATGPVECQQFMGYDFKSQMFSAMFWLPSYSEWLTRKADLVPTYRYVKRTLKLLQWRCPPRRWRLKNPSHSLFITALNEVFPDARFVMTHRDIRKVLPSMGDLYFELQRVSSDHVDLRRIGELTSDFCEIKMRRMIAFRDAGNDPRMFDIYFEPFQEDPFPTIERLYDFLGEEFTDAARTAMRQWLRSNAETRRLVEHNEAATFGIDLAELGERFRFYTERFHVPAAQPGG